jgi:hypothetical protein
VVVRRVGHIPAYVIKKDLKVKGHEISGNFFFGWMNLTIRRGRLSTSSCRSVPATCRVHGTVARKTETSTRIHTYLVSLLGSRNVWQVYEVVSEPAFRKADPEFDSEKATQVIYSLTISYE